MRGTSVRDGSGSSAARWSEQPDPAEQGHAQIPLSPSKKEQESRGWRGYVVRVGDTYANGYERGPLCSAYVYSLYRDADEDARYLGGCVWSYSRALSGGFGGGR